MYQHQLIDYNKRTTPMQMLIIGELGYGGGEEEAEEEGAFRNTILANKIFGKPKTALRNKVISIKKVHAFKMT